MVRRSTLSSGSVSASVRRQTLIVLALVSLLWRVVPLVRLVRRAEEATGALAEYAYLWPFEGARFGLMGFLSHEQLALVGSPLYLLLAAIETQFKTQGAILLLLQTLASVALPFVVLRVGTRALGFVSGAVGAFVCALSAPLLLSGLTLIPTLFMTLAGVAYAGQLFAFGQRREPGGAVWLGVACGGLCWIGGALALWLPATLGWLPWMSRSFRGRAGLSVAAWVLAGWILALSPLMVRSLLVQGDLVLPFQNAGFDLYVAANSDQVVQDDSPDNMPYAVGRRARSIMLEGESHRTEWGRSWHYFKAAARARPLDAVGARALAFVGGLVDGPVVRSTEPARGLLRYLPMIPGGLVGAVSWLGILALLASIRTYWPLFAGLAVPGLVAVSTGVAASVQILSLPFIALLAAYGLVRWWDARSAPITWLLGPMALALGAWLTWAN